MQALGIVGVGVEGLWCVWGFTPCTHLRAQQTLRIQEVGMNSLILLQFRSDFYPESRSDFTVSSTMTAWSDFTLSPSLIFPKLRPVTLSPSLNLHSVLV